MFYIILISSIYVSHQVASLLNMGIDAKVNVDGLKCWLGSGEVTSTIWPTYSSQSLSSSQYEKQWKAKWAKMNYSRISSLQISCIWAIGIVVNQSGIYFCCKSFDKSFDLMLTKTHLPNLSWDMRVGSNSGKQEDCWGKCSSYRIRFLVNKQKKINFSGVMGKKKNLYVCILSWFT